MQRVTVIGCGHGGQALAADLTQRGCQVTLYADTNHAGGLHAIATKKGIDCKGIIKQFIRLFCVTTNLKLAIQNSHYIFIVLPSYAHHTLFNEMLTFLKPGQVIITMAANFASLRYLKTLIKLKKINEVDLIDIATLPYVCRADQLGSVEIIAVKNKIAIASFPATAATKYVPILNRLLPSQCIVYQDVLSLGLNILSGMIHPAITLLNAGRISPNKESFYFYKDGITPEIAKLIEKLDNERMEIGARLNLKTHTFLELINQYYDTFYESIYQFFCESLPHNTLPLCPTSLQQRYITQDVAHVLVPWHYLAQLTRVKTPVLNCIINLASIMNNNNYLLTGVNLEKLNLENKSIIDIKEYVKTGLTPTTEIVKETNKTYFVDFELFKRVI